MKIVDAHYHLAKTVRMEEVEGLTESWRKQGVVHTCISGVPTVFKTKGNEELLEISRKFPERITAFAFVDLRKDRPEIIDDLAARGFGGLKMTNSPKSYGDESFFPFYEKALENKLPILFHTGYLARELNTANCDFMRPIQLDTIGRRLPGLKIIGAHLGNPWYEEAILVIRKNKNVFFDLSGLTFYTKAPSYYRMIFSRQEGECLRSRKDVIDYDVFRQLVFGSDEPDVGKVAEFYKNLFDFLEVPDDIRERVFYKNMSEILGKKFE